MPRNQQHAAAPRRRARSAALIAASALAVMAAGCAGGGRAKSADNAPKADKGASMTQYQEISNAAQFTKIGERGEAAYIFTPTSAKGGSAPVIFFFHGLAATDPYSYGGWIEHLVSNGNIVIYPVGEDSKFSRAEKIRSNTVVGAKAALKALSAGPVKPDLDRVAYVGHSVGGGLSVQIAANAKQYGMPVPKAIMAVQPGGSKNPTDPNDVKRLPSSTLLLTVEGDTDQFEDTREGRMIVENADAIPAKNRVFILMTAPKTSTGVDHYTPLSPDPRYQMLNKSGKKGRKALMSAFGVRDGEINSIDSKGFWTLFDDLLKAAFSGGSVSQAADRAGAKPLTAVSQNATKSLSAANISGSDQFMQLTID